MKKVNKKIHMHAMSSGRKSPRDSSSAHYDIDGYTRHNLATERVSLSFKRALPSTSEAPGGTQYCDDGRPAGCQSGHARGS